MSETITFTPHPDLEKIDPEFRRKWADDLRTSVQHRRSLANKDRTAFCCLGRAVVVAGIEFDEGISGSRLGGVRPIAGCDLRLLMAATRGDTGEHCPFAYLNDDFLTHPQIADLLDGKTVTVPVVESKTGST